ncbi:MAG: D-alanyl-D-alanine carboxypeptidase [Flammeovirgaceae bacterium]|nr:D-alanyl-D-alanine carboxypeptidase [Flammeovirgaceae bacterium]
MQILRYLPTLLAFLCLFSGCKTYKIQKSLDKQLVKNQKLKHNFSGLALYDATNEKMIYKHNAERYFIPASNTKIYTFYTALNTLGDSVPGIEYIIQNDTLTFWATGAPDFLNIYFEKERDQVLEFLKSRKEVLVFAERPYEDPASGYGWAWDDYNDYYSAERSAFPIYGNVVHFEKDSGSALLQVIPSLMADSLTLGEPRKYPYVQRKQFANQFEYYFQDSDAYNNEVPMILDTKLTLELLKDTLQKEIYQTQFDSSFLMHPVKSVFSIHTDTLLQRMMQPSDNFLAEQTIILSSHLQLGRLTTSDMIQYTLDSLLADLPDRPRWVDGSGLSRYNLFSPRTTVHVFHKLYHQIEEDRLFNMLAVGGKSGTLKNWYGADEPYVFGKTGTLSNNHSVSGYLKTKSGKTLIFSFMHNNYMVYSSAIKREMEKIFIYLRDNY